MGASVTENQQAIDALAREITLLQAQIGTLATKLSTKQSQKQDKEAEEV